MAAAALLLPPSSRYGVASDPTGVKTESQLDAEWASTAADLVRRAVAGGHGELAALIRGWQLPDEGQRQFILTIPAVPPQAAPPCCSQDAQAPPWRRAGFTMTAWWPPTNRGGTSTSAAETRPALENTRACM